MTATASPKTFTARARQWIVGDDADTAPITTAIIVLNAIVYVACALSAHDSTAFITMKDHDETLRLFGANDALHSVGDSRLETLVTSCFLHGSLLHIAFNMIALRQVGPFVERSVGPARFAPLYLISGIFGSFTSAMVGWLTGPRMSVGASGAICGVIGAAMVLGARTQGIRAPLTLAMARWLGGVFILGYVAHFDNAAHIGGAVCGAAIAALWQRDRFYSKFLERIVLGVCALVIVVSGLVTWYRDTHDPYLFKDERDRQRALIHFVRSGQCNEARYAFHRAKNLAPHSPDMQVLERDLMSRCP